MIPQTLQPYLDDTKLYLEAITHRSYCNEHPRTEHNERLEFLGDAILEYLVSKELFIHFPNEPEGILTSMRSKLVQTSSLSKIAGTLELGQHLRLSKGEEKSNGRNNPALLENAFEALVGAIYLNNGINTAHKFLKNYLFPQIDLLDPNKLKDPKSLFQELVQAKNLPTPVYEVTEEQGPDHDKIFTMAVLVENIEWGRGQGPSKQKATQAAAQEGLKQLEKMI